MKQKTILGFALFATILVVSAAPVTASHGQLAVGSAHSSSSDFENGSVENVIVYEGDVFYSWYGEWTIAPTTKVAQRNGSSFTDQWGLEFNDDGTKMFTFGYGDTVRQWSLSTPYDITTSTYQKGYSTSAQTSYGTGLAFGDNGTKMYVTDEGTSILYQYSLSTAYDVGSASYVRSLDFTGGNKRNVNFNPSGTKMYVTAYDSGQIWTYSLSTAWDISTASRTSTWDTPQSSELPSSIEFGADGSKMFISYYNGVSEHNLSTPYQVTSASLVEENDFEDRSYGFEFTADGESFVTHRKDFRQYRVGQIPNGTGSYQSTNHSVSNAAQGWTDLTLENASANVEWQGYDASSGQWQVVNSSTFSTSGNKTLDISGTSYDTWRVNVSFSKTGSNPTAQLHDEGILVETHAPNVDDSSLSPNSTSTSTDESVTLSASISDSDFGTSHGDTATVHWYVDGSKRTTTTATSNGTVSHTLTSMGAGEHNWHIEVADDYGHRVTSATAQFAAPGELQILNESDPQQLVKGPNTTVTLRFYFDDGGGMVVKRTTSDGTIDMTGLPVDESFVVVADAPGYLSRRIFVQSLLQTQKVYLLPETATVTESVFELRDYSGDFPQSGTVLQVQRSLNDSWQTVTGDFFGANGRYPVQLERNVRHRLVLINTRTGEERVVGPYTPLAGGQQVIKVYSSGDIDLISPAVVDVSPSVRSLPDVSGTEITARLDPRGGNVSAWSTNATYHKNGTVTTLATATRTSGGAVDLTLDLGGRSGGTVKVTVTYTVDGITNTETVEYSVYKSYQHKYSLFNTLTRVDTLVPAGNRASFKAFLSLIVTVALTTGGASKFRTSTEMAGLTAVGCLAGFSIIGWISYDVVFASVVAFGAFTAVRRGL